MALKFQRVKHISDIDKKTKVKDKTKITLKYLNKYANQKAKLITDKPVKIVIGVLPRDVVARHFKIVFTPDDKSVKPYITSYEIMLDRTYYTYYKNNSYELKQGILHELAHTIIEKGHDKEFKKIARKLGADQIHQTALWD